MAINLNTSLGLMSCQVIGFIFVYFLIFLMLSSFFSKFYPVGCLLFPWVDVMRFGVLLILHMLMPNMNWRYNFILSPIFFSISCKLERDLYNYIYVKAKELGRHIRFNIVSSFCFRTIVKLSSFYCSVYLNSSGDFFFPRK